MRQLIIIILYWNDGCTVQPKLTSSWVLCVCGPCDGTARPLQAPCGAPVPWPVTLLQLSVCPHASIINVRERTSRLGSISHLRVHAHTHTHLPRHGFIHSSRHVGTHAAVLILLSEPMLWTHRPSGRRRENILPSFHPSIGLLLLPSPLSHQDCTVAAAQWTTSIRCVSCTMSGQNQRVTTV